MKKNIYIIGVVLVILSIIGAGATSATVSMADTGNYDNTNGKKILIYGDVLKAVTVHWENVDNSSEYRTETTEGINSSSYLFTISQVWNASFVVYEITVINFNNDLSFFSGGFSTVALETEQQQDLTNYSHIQIISDSLKSDIMMWMLGNASYKMHFSSVETTIIDSISEYIEGMVTELRLLGYTDNQIDEMKEVIADGYIETQRTEREQNIEIAEAEKRGWWSGVQLIAIFIVVIIVLIGVWVFVKGYVRMPSMKRVKRKTQPTEDVDIFV